MLLTAFLALTVFAAVPYAGEEEVLAVNSLTTGLGANDLGNMVWDGSMFWLEGSGALSKLTGEGHSVTDWITYREEEGFGRGSIAAMWALGDIIIASWAYGTTYNEEPTTAGDGISLSLDHGTSWQNVSVVDMFPDRADFKLPGNRTVIYDIRVEDGVIWCSTTAGFLLRSDNWGYTWTQILPRETKDEEVEFTYSNPNHHANCVDVYGDTLWVGTFQGMNLSVDGGETWTNFSWPRDGSGDPGAQWPGNFPTAVEHKVVGGKTHVWVASHPYEVGKYGICHTDDNGQTWEYKKLLDIDTRPYDIDFGSASSSDPAVSDSTVIVSTISGLLISYDLGETWEKMTISESSSLNWDDNTSVAMSLVVGDTLWVTSSDGLAKTTDWGKNWEIFKGVLRVKTIDTGSRDIGISSLYDYQNDTIKTYAFPNPFTPSRGDRNYAHTKIQYALEKEAWVTVTIYTYTGKLLRQLIANEYRSGGRDYQEVWDGRDGDNNIVPNGVYFYRIKTNRGNTANGKIMVLD